MEHFVGRLDPFVGWLELFVGRLDPFVERLEHFVGWLELFVGRLECTLRQRIVLSIKKPTIFPIGNSRF
ncbi:MULTISPECIES: hypothetical protein [Allobacillus]|uniref:Uncharacterized protein n=1 Tax=Allobacillus halotolerans TaxID=570278 RepID=A0ABS6GLZ2_9BACI|nr:MULTISPECIES: hypothetical protein [Allobacillus]MBU6080160.1 hypothetical protein [Allobacillus halotolerans]TSJ68367.1 hypothetical protein FPQ10_04070 [Allobacillus sp. SKP2-8]